MNCPHCNMAIEPAPKRKKKCLMCGKDIYVRTDPLNKNQLLLKADDAFVLDMISYFGVSERAYSEIMSKARGNRKLGDTIWPLLNKEKQKAAKRGDWNTVSSITYQQARYYYKTDRDYFRKPLNKLLILDI